MGCFLHLGHGVPLASCSAAAAYTLPSPLLPTVLPLARGTPPSPPREAPFSSPSSACSWPRPDVHIPGGVCGSTPTSGLSPSQSAELTVLFVSRVPGTVSEAQMSKEVGISGSMGMCGMRLWGSTLGDGKAWKQPSPVTEPVPES